MSPIRELLDLPEAVRKGDFVLSLARGVENPEETVRTYAVTPGLLQAFGRALSIIDSALQGGRSQAAFLHGSFGAGKSHFMAVLDLMLQGHPAAWQRPEFHPFKARYAWLAEPKILQLPMHMIGAENIEQKVFSSYVVWVKEHHPDAPIPALYADQELFENARRLRQTMGDEKFFAALNEGTEAKAGWGKRSSAWDAARFEEALRSTDKDQREKLFGQLVKTHFPAFTGQTHRFIELDRGLAVLARHAASLGYKAVVLYLDELILWLAGKVANLTFVQDEAQKLAKLKEAQDEGRDIPIVSFIARQRDLSQLVGDKAAGEVRTTLEDSLAWSKGRFETVTLEDRNLPAVVAHRVVRAKDERSRALLDEAFARMRRGLGDAWGTLLGATGEEPDFKKVYPFSPALLDALVAVSDCLQRERTALRVLMELLVEHLRTLEVGQVVPVGDIFDVLAAGEDAFDPIMQARFNRARELYRSHLLPIIQEQNKTTTRERCQRLRPEHPAGLGCSDCPEKACRNDNRLAKTLLMAAFVPNAGPFKAFTVSRLVQLNPGAVVSPIPGTEVSIAAGRLREWATRIGPLRVGEQADPEVGIRLEGVDLHPILEQAREAADKSGVHRQLLQDLLFEALRLQAAGGQRTVTHELEWRGTKRPGRIRFANVRELAEDALTCPPELFWQVVIDYPFDEAGFTPADDLEQLEKARDALGGRKNPTFVWLPSFFSDKVKRELGQLAVLEHILTGDNGKKYLGHLRPEDQTRARMDLDSLRNQKRALVRRAMEQAYGLTAQRDEGMLDPARLVDEPWIPLAPGLPSRPLLAVDFAHALEQLADRLLSHQFPHHPRFEAQVTPGKLEKVREIADKLLNAQGYRAQVDRAEHKLLKEYAAPLGLISLSELLAQLEEGPLKAMEQRRAQAAVESPTVESARRYADPEGTMGLPVEAADLLVYTYAVWSGRSLERGGRPHEIERVGRIPDDVELIKPELPEREAWHVAIDRAGELFGLGAPGRALNARNLAALGQKLAEEAGRFEAARRLAGALRPRLEEWTHGDAQPPRLATALSGQALLEGLSARRAIDQVRFLAAFEPRTSAVALARSLKDAQAVLQALNDEARWLNFKSVRALLGDETRRHRARELLDELAAGLAADQLNTALPELLRGLTQKAAGLLESRPLPPSPPSPPPEPAPGFIPVATPEFTVTGDVAKALAEAQAGIARELAKLALDGEVRVGVRLTVQRKGGGGKA